jgi:hypothetical protein
MCANMEDILVQANDCTMECIRKGTPEFVDIIAEVERTNAMCDCVAKAAP